MLNVYLIFTAAASLIAVIVFGMDKKFSKNEYSRRVPEIVLLSLISLGGAAGGLVGMYGFRHKTIFKDKFHFGIGLWLSLIMQIALGVFIYLVQTKGLDYFNI